MRMVLLVVMLMGWSGSAWSKPYAFFNGNNLHSQCSGGNIYICQGYIVGAFDVMAHNNGIFKNSGEGTNFRTCPPPIIATEQAIDIVISYLKNHPEQRHFSAASQVALALSKAWPCK